MAIARIQSIAEQVRCSAGQSVDCAFDVINATDRTLRVGLDVIGEAQTWAQIDRDRMELLLPPRGQQKVKITLTAPPGTASSKSSFRLRAYSSDDPTQAVESSSVGIDVGAQATLPERGPSATAPQRTPWIFVVATTAAIAVLAAGITAAILLRPSKVPEVAGLTLDEALAVLSDAELTSSVTEEASVQAEAGRVLRQAPAAGAAVPANRSVRIVIATAAPAALAAPAGWESLGDMADSSPAISSWGPGRLDVFVRRSDNAIWHKSFENRWSDWESLGGSLSSDPAAVSWGPGRIDLFARGTDDALWHKWFEGGWSGWESLGGGLKSAPAAASWGRGRLDVFAQGGNDALWHKWFDGGWGAWESLGGGIHAAPAAVSWASNRIDVFVRGQNDQMFHRAFAGSWGPWDQLPSPWNGQTLTAGPAVASWSPGRLDVLARGAGGALIHTWYAGQWSPWETLASGMTSDPDAVSWAPNRIDVVARGENGLVLHKYWDGSAWRP